MEKTKCSYCGSVGTSKESCPLNPLSKRNNYGKHYKLTKSDKVVTKEIIINNKQLRKPYIDNIEKLTEKNKNYRKVLYTTPNTQLVLMSLKPQEEIGTETHKDTTQFLRIEEGHGVAIVNGITTSLGPGSAVIIAPGMEHNIINKSRSSRMQIYTLYSPPHHPINIIQKNKPLED
ncbi:MAG: cupin domain-containing protein [Candidatus Paceibacterota bacterium]